MKHHQRVIGLSDEWFTPEWILKPLGNFDLDPCTSENRPWDTATSHYTAADDGLTKHWFGRVWLNPPFNRFLRPQWMKRMAEHRNGIMLIPGACETRCFQEYVFGVSDGILTLDRRPHFCNSDGEAAKHNSGCTIVLVAYGADNLNVLQRSNLGTVLIELPRAVYLQDA